MRTHPDAERATLAAALESPEALAEVRAIVSAGDFSDPKHRAIFETLEELDAKGSKIDVVTVAEHLGSTRVAVVGGLPYLVELVDGTPAVHHVADHAELVATAAKVRRVQSLARRLDAEANGDIGDPREWLRRAEAEVYNLTQETGRTDRAAIVGELVDTELAALGTRKTFSASAIPTGWRGLDRMTGGLRRGTMTVLAARPGVGKSAWALGAAVGAARAGHAAVYCSLEMSREQLTQRAIAQAAIIDTGALERGELTPEDLRACQVALDRLKALPLAFEDSPALSVAGVRAAVRRCVARLRRKGHSERLGVIVLDYLQLMSSDSARKNGTRETEVAEASRGLVALAKEFDVAVLALSQLNRETEKGTLPQLSNLRESGAIEQDAFGVFMLHRPAESEVEVLVRKLRQGGRCGSYPMTFDSPSTRFLETADSFEDLDSPPDWADGSA
jgi:replicative DNA helicase